MAERQHTEHAAKRRSKGGKAHGAEEPMREHERGAADFWRGKSHGAKELVRQHSDRWEAELFVSRVSDDRENAVPRGNLATPIAVAVGALILGKMFGGSAAPRHLLFRQIRQLTVSSAAFPTSSASSPLAAPRRRSILGSALGRTSRSSRDSLARRSASRR